MILDIGPKTVSLIKDIINNSNTILWNGPAGYFENPEFSKGSEEIAKKIIERKKQNKIYCVSGGGDTVAVLNSFGLTNDFLNSGVFPTTFDAVDLPPRSPNFDAPNKAAPASNNLFRFLDFFDMSSPFNNIRIYVPYNFEPHPRQHKLLQKNLVDILT